MTKDALRRPGQTPDDQITMLFDADTLRPACVLLQAMAGCIEAREVVSLHFDPHTWILAPTSNMKILHGTRLQFEDYANELNAAPR